MLSKSISLSQQVASMSLKSQFIFTWCIPHLDDFGLIENRTQILKAMVFPMNRFIRTADIEMFIDEAEREGLIEVFEDCLEFSGFENHQSISPEKKSKSKFSKVPLNNPRIPKNPQESPVQISIGELSIGEDRLVVETSSTKLQTLKPTPSAEAKDFFTGGKVYEDIISEFSQNADRQWLEMEAKKFVFYWTEKDRSGRRERWQQQPTFEVKRRFYTWLTRANEKFKSQAKAITV